MPDRLSRIFVVGLLAAAAPAPALRCQQTARPNVIVIITDDQGWGDIGYHNPAVHSPNLDALARSGARFTQHYVMPQCTPTRVAVNSSAAAPTLPTSPEASPELIPRSSASSGSISTTR